MTEHPTDGSVRLPGLDGSNPLGFLAALGVLRILDEAAQKERAPAPRLSWDEASAQPVLHRVDTVEALRDAIVDDVKMWGDDRAIGLVYPKAEKAGVKAFRGLKPPVAVLRGWLNECLREPMDWEMLGLAAALTAETATEAIPEKKLAGPADYEAISCPFDPSASTALSTLPTAFDFTTRNAQFLDQVRLIREGLDGEIIFDALSGQAGADGAFSGRTMGWDPAAERPAALYSYGRQPSPVLEWCAFRSLPFFPVFGRDGKLHTTACTGRRKDGTFTWPLWRPPIGARVIRSLLSYPSMGELTNGQRNLLGVLRILQVTLDKAADGYTGVFSPTRTL
jgi:hypothetical protein